MYYLVQSGEPFSRTIYDSLNKADIAKIITAVKESPLVEEYIKRKV